MEMISWNCSRKHDWQLASCGALGHVSSCSAAFLEQPKAGRGAQAFLARQELLGGKDWVSFSRMFLRTILLPPSLKSTQVATPFSAVSRANYCEKLNQVPAPGGGIGDRQLLFLIRPENVTQAVTGMFFSSFSAGSSMPNRMTRPRLLSSMMGKDSSTVGASPL